MDEFVIARNPEEGSSLPFLVRLPIGADGIVLKVRDTWPRTAKIYCHAAIEWPSNPEILERVSVRSCLRRGASIDLILDRGRENRSQFVFTKARGRDMIFWQSARTAKQARPNVTVPTKRASGRVLEIVVDSHEQYAWKFSEQQATTVRRALPAGDYAVEEDGRIVAAVERKSLQDLVATLTSGKLRFLLAALSDVPRAALVVEDRYSSVFKLTFVRPSVVAEGLAEAQVRYPGVPIVFCETRALAQEWTYRFLGAALDHHGMDDAADRLIAALPGTGPLPPPTGRPLGRHTEGPADDGPPAAVIRTWARGAGLDVPDRGRLRPEIKQAYAEAHPSPGEAGISG